MTERTYKKDLEVLNLVSGEEQKCDIARILFLRVAVATVHHFA